MNDPDMKWFGSHLQEAKGVYIVPKLTKGAFIFGVEGGNGVVLAREDKSGGWSEPVFYETSAASFGLQAGAQSSEAVVLIMTPKAVDSLMANKIKLGADGNAGLGPKGGGADTNLTADFVTFTRAKGLYAGSHSMEHRSGQGTNSMPPIMDRTCVRRTSLLRIRRNRTPTPSHCRPC